MRDLLYFIGVVFLGMAILVIPPFFLRPIMGDDLALCWIPVISLGLVVLGYVQSYYYEKRGKPDWFDRMGL